MELPSDHMPTNLRGDRPMTAVHTNAKQLCCDHTNVDQTDAQKVQDNGSYLGFGVPILLLPTRIAADQSASWLAGD
jgi:hypothetical protein